MLCPGKLGQLFDKSREVRFKLLSTQARPPGGPFLAGQRNTSLTQGLEMVTHGGERNLDFFGEPGAGPFRSIPEELDHAEPYRVSYCSEHANDADTVQVRVMELGGHDLLFHEKAYTLLFS
ncbi:hypothetical protein M707_15240 [Arthrobacter sp. AK-YN10]|jgi:hypothetical protein|nr:hypothetical protein AUT26_20135 [Arthrobacter sp. ATCC 21022]ERI36798.1 hypothetical protein M707_15240 [Arthrobacter sp. AK-YN10]KUR63067.1 hypothetical protein JM67_18950 [Arthrobacter sp. ATCC 21022]QSZ52195.1 hypothetical protein AYX19_03735 [Paenarthrobacter ureafaciens]